MYTLVYLGWPRDKEAFLCLGGRASYEDDSLSGSFSFPLLLKAHPCKPNLLTFTRIIQERACRIKAESVTTLFQ